MVMGTHSTSDPRLNQASQVFLDGGVIGSSPNTRQAAATTISSGSTVARSDRGSVIRYPLLVRTNVIRYWSFVLETVKRLGCWSCATIILISSRLTNNE